MGHLNYMYSACNPTMDIEVYKLVYVHNQVEMRLGTTTYMFLNNRGLNETIEYVTYMLGLYEIDLRSFEPLIENKINKRKVDNLVNAMNQCNL